MPTPPQAYDEERNLSDRMVALEVEMRHVRSDLTAIHAKLDSMQERFDASQAKSDARFDAMQAKSDARFDAMEAKSDARFHAMEAKSDARFDAMQAKSDRAFCDLKEKFDAASKEGQAKTDVRFDAMQAEFKAMRAESDARYNDLQLKVANIQATMLTKDEFRDFLDKRFSPLEQRNDKFEARILRTFVGLFTGALLLFATLLFHTAR
jgi:hypothetical protein